MKTYVKCAPMAARLRGRLGGRRRIRGSGTGPGVGVVLLALSSTAAAPLQGQIPWESTMLMSPSAPAGVSAHLVRFDYAIDNALGGVVTYRPLVGAGGVGYRFAVAEGNLDGDLAFAGGLDVSGLLLPHDAEFPVDLMWFAGIGGGYADYGTVAVPVGIAFGRGLDGRAGWFNPYLSTRAVLEKPFGDAAPPDAGVELGIAVDVGVDLAFGASRALIVRLGASLGDRQTLAMGLNVGPR